MKNHKFGDYIKIIQHQYKIYGTFITDSISNNNTNYINIINNL